VAKEPDIERKRRFIGMLVVATVLCAAMEVRAAALAGKVLALGDGMPVSQAMVTVTFGAETAGPHAITVFTGETGEFIFPADLPDLKNARAIRAKKLGFRQTEKEGDALRHAVNEKEGVTLYLEAADNIAAQVPASAWLEMGPPGQDRNITVASCSSCHQLASPRMRAYAAQIEAVRGGPEGDARALEAWRKVVRHEAWRTIVKYMRSMHYSVFPLESKMTIDAIDWTTAQNAGLNFFNADQGETVAHYLAEHFPRTTEYLSAVDYGYGAELGVTGRTVIREYAFPEKALVRELVPVPNGDDLWGADVKRNKIVRLNPATGESEWHDVDFGGATGPHTIVSDDSGDLWVSMVDNDQFGHFNPETENGSFGHCGPPICRMPILLRVLRSCMTCPSTRMAAWRVILPGRSG
jgi:mono/diheme cytochrome c family protein